MIFLFIKEILGIEKNASQKQIKTAYYRLAKEYHPDMSNQQNAHTKFSQINTAYQYMINGVVQGNRQEKTSAQDKKTNEHASEYEKNYQKAKKNKNKNKGRDFEQQQEELTEEDFNEFEKAFKSFINKGRIDPKHRVYSRFFAQFFTSQQNHEEIYDQIHQGQQQDDNISSRDLKIITINAKLNITRQQAQEGVTKNVLYKKTILCQGCLGRNTETKKTKCRKCGGTGFTGKGIDDIRCCPVCSGGGSAKTHGCKQCKGKGLVQIHVQQSVTVPRHAYQNQQVILRGRGNQHPRKFYYGDVYIKLRINNKPLVRVDGMNTFSTIKLSISDAILGTTVQYATLRGNKKIDIERVTLDEQELVMKGEGLKKGAKTGDHHLKVKVQIPTSLTKQQQEIYMRLRDLEKMKYKYTSR